MTVDRRGFIRTLGATAALFSGCSSPQGGKTLGGKPPNIVILIADQLRYQSCGYAGDARARTPRIDQIAGEGVDFAQTVSGMPVCCAYRASLFTGKHTSSTGMVINELRMRTDHTCLGHCLARAGYDTGYIGKWHLYANQLGHHRDPNNSFVLRGPHRLGFDGYWAAYNFHHNYYGAYYHTETTEKIFYGEGVYEPDAQTDMAIDYMGRAAAGDRPFALVVSYGVPHDPWNRNNVPEEYYEMFRDVSFPVPPNYSDRLDPYGDAWSDIDKSPEKIDEWMRVYYAMTASLDHNIGRLLDAMSRLGIDEETIVIFTSDHGEMFGAQGRMKKNIFYEEAARVPFVMRWPRRIPAGIRTDALLNTPDIMPTLLALAGIPIPGAVEGMDLSHVARGMPGPEPEHAFLMNTGACATWENGHEWRALRTRKHTYAVYRDPRKELLFDNAADPFQMKDLAGDERHQDLLRSFRSRLERQMAALGDGFPESTWYRDNWIENRIIKRTATMGGE